MPIAREILNMLDLGPKLTQVISVVFFTSKLAKIPKDKCSHRAMITFDGHRRPHQ